MENKVKLVKFNALNLISSYDETYAKLSWSVRMGYPRLSVYLDAKDFTEKIDYSKQIIAALNIVTTETLLGLLEKVISGDNDTSYELDCFNAKWDNGVKTNEKVLQATIVVGKDEIGVIYLSVRRSGTKEINFPITIDKRWFRLKGKSGAEIDDPATLSKLESTAYLSVLRKTFAATYLDNTKVVMLDKKGPPTTKTYVPRTTPSYTTATPPPVQPTTPSPVTDGNPEDTLDLM